MMKRIYPAIVFAVAFQIALQGRTFRPEPEKPSLEMFEIMPIQLKGLKSVSLTVFVSPFDIPDSEEIRQNIERTAKKIITESGLSLGREQGAWFSISVYPNSVRDRIPREYFIVQIRTELSDEATLKRDPMLRNPHGYTIWHRDWVELIHREELVTQILEEVRDQVEEFCSQWKMVKELTSIDSPISVGAIMDKRIYNLSGWNLPETPDLQFVSREIINHPDIPVTLEVEKYESKARSTRDEYFILNAFVDKGKVMPGLFVREYPEELKVYRDAESGDILCYYYVRMAEYVPRSEQEAHFYITVDAKTNFILDLDNDGKYESGFDASTWKYDETESLIALLKLKFGSCR